VRVCLPERKNVDILKNVWLKCSRYFRRNKIVYLRNKIKEPETNIGKLQKAAGLN
jgi:hypothetical protein